MRKLSLRAGGMAVLLAATLLWLNPGKQSRKSTPPPSEITSTGQHPGYFAQWFELHKDKDGKIPRLLHTNWKKHDEKMAPLHASQRANSPFSSIQFMGPLQQGGRTRALLIDADNPSKAYAGSVSGGLWITLDAGASWTPVNDQETSLMVVDITQSPFDSDVLYYCTGESRANSAGVPGDGVFKSTDGGQTFTQLLSTTTDIAFDYTWKIKHSLNDPNTVYLGSNTRGLLRTVDGGATWQNVVSSGSIVDILTFSDGGVMYAASSNGLYYSSTGNPGSFSKINSNTFPASFARIEIANCASQPDVLYAGFESPGYNTGAAGVAKSTDRGQTWTTVNTPPIGPTYGRYCFVLGVHHNDPDKLMMAGVSGRWSHDGGTTWSFLGFSHADYHAYASHPSTPDQFWMGNDGGVYRYAWSNPSFTPVNLNEGYYTTQYYAGDYAPAGKQSIGGTQDNGTWKVEQAYSRRILGADGAHCHVSLQDANLAYASTQNGFIRRTNNFQDEFVSWRYISTNATMNAERYYFINPYQINYADGEQLYVRTNQGLWRTVDAGTTWTKITGGYFGLYGIGVTEDANPTVYVGGSSATLLRIDNAASANPGTEKDLSASVPSQVTFDFIQAITVDPNDDGTLYIGFSNFNTNPRAWRVTAANTNSPVWENISGDLPPRVPVNYLQPDPVDPANIIYAGTDYGLYYTLNGGLNWIKELSIPNVSIHELKLRKSDRTLHAFTHGRGIWYLELDGTSAVCPATVSTFPYAEGFESGAGDWTQDGDEDLDWSWEAGSTPTSNTGPSQAHEGNRYFYTESNNPNHPGKVARLTSPCFNFVTTAHPVLYFRYHMHGSKMGEMKVQIQSGGTWVTLWSQSGNQGDQWLAAKVDLAAFAGLPQVKLRFEGITGDGHTSDMAIDQVTVEDAPPCVSSYPYVESFEQNDLGQPGAWKQEDVDDFDWSRHSGATNTKDTGPGSASDGLHYLYTEANDPNIPGKVADLSSSCFDFSGLGNPELTFTYHMYGQDMGSLELQISEDNEATWLTLWQKSGDQGDAWKSDTINLSGYAGRSDLHFRFHAVTAQTNTHKGDMAIDRIVISEGFVCPSVDFGEYTVSSMGQGQDHGISALYDKGKTLYIQGNAWKSIDLAYLVTSETVLEFDFNVKTGGEVHAIGFDDDVHLTEGRMFQLAGTQGYGIQDYNTYSMGTGYQTYVIPVGQFYTGTFDRLVFAADHDAQPKNGESYFRNLRIYEGTCEGPPPSTPSGANTVASIRSGQQVLAAWPNPFSESLNLDLSDFGQGEVKLSLYDLSGRELISTSRQAAPQVSLSTGALPSGIYFIRAQADELVKTTKVVRR